MTSNFSVALAWPKVLPLVSHFDSFALPLHQTGSQIPAHSGLKIVFLAFLLGFGLKFVYRPSTYSSGRLPDGPRGLPIVGELNTGRLMGVLFDANRLSPVLDPLS